MREKEAKRFRAKLSKNKMHTQRREDALRPASRIPKGSGVKKDFCSPLRNLGGLRESFYLF